MPTLAGHYDSLLLPDNGRGGTRTLPTDGSETPIPEHLSADHHSLPDDCHSAAHTQDPALTELFRVWPALSGWTRWQIQQLIESQHQSNSLTNIDCKSESDSQSY